MLFSEIYCQDRAIGVLQRAYAADRVAGAYIFAGPGGVGKDTTARVFAKLLLCEQPAGDEGSGYFEPCGECDSCRLYESDEKSESHPDFALIYKELSEYTEKGRNKTTPVDLPIDVVREFLIDKASQRPSLSQRRVYVVLEAERLNNSSQNALLKVLEEPPPYCTIILICTSAELLLPTTRSRCQLVSFGPVKAGIITEKLERMGLDSAKSRFFANLSQGSVGLAFAWARLQDEVDLYEIKRRIVDDLATGKYEQSLGIAERLIGHSKAIAAAWAELEEKTSKTDINRRADKTVLRIVMLALSDAMKFGVGIHDNLTNSDQKSCVEALARRFDPEIAAEKAQLCGQAAQWVDASANQKLIFERLLLNLADFGIIQGS